jgi:hypothetical protein
MTTHERDDRPTRPSDATRDEEERDAQVRPGNRTASVLSSHEPLAKPRPKWATTSPSTTAR